LKHWNVFTRKAPIGIRYNTATGKSEGRFKNETRLSLNMTTTTKRSMLITKLKNSESPMRLIDSLSVLGITIASSNLKDETTVIIPIRLK
jgi:hypothetical protein